MIRTIYCSQPYLRRPSGLEKGHMRRFLSERAALTAARAMRRDAPGVVVFKVQGTPEADYWTDPILIARYGDVPPEAA